MAKKSKLELTWIGKDDRPRLEPRVLLEDSSNSYHAAERITDDDSFDNRLICGDNLLALKALENEFAGRLKCIYIDPPYNAEQALNELYDDSIEHSQWLSLMRDRFDLLRKLLRRDGTFFCQLNDDEVHYAKVLLDEVFGRSNFLNQVSVRMKQTAGASGGGEDKRLKKNVEYILIYAKEREGDGGFEQFNDVYEEENLFDVIEEMREAGQSWKYTNVLLDKGTFVEERTVLDGSGQPIVVRKYRGLTRTTIREKINAGASEAEAYSQHFESIFSDTNAQTSIRTRIIDEFKTLEADECLVSEYVPRSGRDRGRLVQHYYISPTIRRVIWLKDTAVRKGNRLVKLEKTGTLWQGFSLNNLTKEGGVLFPHGKKPEALIRRVLDLATETGDWVLDSFAGSGTTGAVAHKMGRNWIMVELGDHCLTHIAPRLKKVCDGEDDGGITEAVGWKGGGGFRYYTLAPSLLEKDQFGNWIINKQYNAPMLAQAICKIEGFTYAPSDTIYWQQGHSTESDFIYVTTQTLTRQQIEALADEVGPTRSLVIYCHAFRAKKVDDFPNLTVKKIPKSVLAKCEWGKDDYSLQIRNLKLAEPEPEPVEATIPPRRRRRRDSNGHPMLFAMEGGEK